MSVDLPAPFSPTIAWISAAWMSMLMSSFATTPGNRLVIPLRRTAGTLVTTSVMGSDLPDSGRARVSSGPSSSANAGRNRPGSPGLALQRGRDRDVSRLDLVGQLVQLVRDV